jgi:uncharacterized membrane protein YfcA
MEAFGTGAKCIPRTSMAFARDWGGGSKKVRPSSASASFLSGQSSMVYGSVEHVLAVSAIGVIAGALSGLLGVTPGGILVPCLALVSGGDQHQAQAVSLVAQLFPTSLAGSRVYRQAGHAAPGRSVLFVASGFLPGAYLGATAALLLSDRILRWAFVAYLVILAVSVSAKGAARSGAEASFARSSRTSAIALVLVGMAAGTSSGLLGIGGGLAIIALLSVVLAVPQHEGQAVSLVVGALPLSLPAVMVYATSQAGPPWLTCALVVCGLLVGTIAGSRIATRLDPHALRRYFVLLISIMAALMAYQAVALVPARP